MRKATLVMATLVAFLLSGPAFSAKKTINVPTMPSMTGGTATSVGGTLNIFGPAITGEFIPAPTSKGISIVPKAGIPVSKIGGMAKGMMKGGAAGMAMGYMFDEMMDGLDWVMHDGAMVKKKEGAAVPTGQGEYQWFDGYGGYHSNPAEACSSYAAKNVVAEFGGRPTRNAVATRLNNDVFSCTYEAYQSWDNRWATVPTFYVGRIGNGCPSGSVYSPSTGACKSNTPVLVPLDDADWDVLDGFVQGKDGVWQRDLATAMCGTSLACWSSLGPERQLTGPSTVSGVPSTSTTTSPNGSSTTTTKTPTTTITYGDNWYDYKTVITTTVTNNGTGETTTTTDDTDYAMPVPPDIFGPANGGIADIRDQIPKETSSISPIPYMPWWSFSQSCEEIDITIPVYGTFRTKNCPIYAQYIWPVLYFFFAVFTWLHCWQVWRGTVLRVRAS